VKPGLSGAGAAQLFGAGTLGTNLEATTHPESSLDHELLFTFTHLESIWFHTLDVDLISVRDHFQQFFRCVMRAAIMVGNVMVSAGE
jgi:hypothetical protein